MYYFWHTQAIPEFRFSNVFPEFPLRSFESLVSAPPPFLFIPPPFLSHSSFPTGISALLQETGLVEVAGHQRRSSTSRKTGKTSARRRRSRNDNPSSGSDASSLGETAETEGEAELAPKWVLKNLEEFNRNLARI
jgi:hypothetical protein